MTDLTPDRDAERLSKGDRLSKEERLPDSGTAGRETADGRGATTGGETAAGRGGPGREEPSVGRADLNRDEPAAVREPVAGEERAVGWDGGAGRETSMGRPRAAGEEPLGTAAGGAGSRRGAEPGEDPALTGHTSPGHDTLPGGRTASDGAAARGVDVDGVDAVAGRGSTAAGRDARPGRNDEFSPSATTTTGTTATGATGTHGAHGATGLHGTTGAHGAHGAEGTGSPLLPGDECDKIGARLRETVSGFVDRPQDAVQEADRLVEELAARFTEALDERRSTLRAAWRRSGGEGTSATTPDTERLRLALRDYRELADRLMHL
ncbi:hypothetical protein ACF1A5_14260 [Streptomyces sp. NPDC014864]|uniref:hypothetical protein n=1 Tax=Streptomyces sp. NPDC014864 TaxID=3364924 RepID=UPI0036F9415B